MTRDTITTEKNYPVIIADLAIVLRLLSPVIISDSAVVKPAFVKREIDWNEAFSFVIPVILKRIQ